ncbi:MAG: CoA transferase, partial [Dehalococcoidia bacterium]|nr:CoA transferase [Dehalococcoidia bacterium]
MAGPLEGIKVVEWAVWHNGPAAGYMLGDLGAEGVKGEVPVRGDRWGGAGA